MLNLLDLMAHPLPLALRRYTSFSALMGLLVELHLLEGGSKVVCARIFDRFF
jgi:hypothetical protein